MNTEFAVDLHTGLDCSERVGNANGRSISRTKLSFVQFMFACVREKRKLNASLSHIKHQIRARASNSKFIPFSSTNFPLGNCFRIIASYLKRSLCHAHMESRE